MKRIVYVLIVFIFSVSAAPTCFGADKKEVKTAKEEVKVPPPPKEMTKDEMLKRMKDILHREEDVMNFIPGLKSEKDAEGNIYYTYQGTKIENLDKATLTKIFGRVRTEAVRLRTDRLTKQLENLRRIQQLTGNAGNPAARIPATPPRPPAAIHVPPVQVTVPPNPPQIPKAPPVPPAPPRR